MNALPEFDFLPYHDGTSRAQRELPALDPVKMPVDERSIRDLLRFAQEYGKELRYFNQNNEAEGDWSAFLDDNDKPDEMVAYLLDPTIFDHDSEKKARYSRPHLVLLLTFLRLLQHAREQMNGLTERHLDFYYRQVLALSTLLGRPDHVHLQAKLELDTEQLLIPAGTLLQAGVDKQGVDLFYQTDEDLVANQAQVDRLMILHVDREIIGLKELKAQLENTPQVAFLEMLKLVYGQFGPGTELPPYANATGVDERFIEHRDKLIAYVQNTLHLSISAFQRVLALYADWKDITIAEEILKILSDAGKKRALGFSFNTSIDKFDFHTNFKTALGFDPLDPENYRGIPAANNLYELFTVYEQHDKNELIEAFIESKQDDMSGLGLKGLHMNTKNFSDLMEMQIERLAKLKDIKKILDEAKRAKREQTTKPIKSGRIEEVIDVIVDYEKNLLDLYFKKSLAIQQVAYEDLNLFGAEAINEEFDRLVKYFHLTTIQDYVFIRAPFLKTTEVPVWQWERSYALLTNAYQRLSVKHIGREPEKIRWRNLYAAPDATQLTVILPGEMDATAGWHTFGKVGRKGDKSSEAGRIGLAIAAPILALSEAARTITLTLIFDPQDFDADALSRLLRKDTFEWQVSTEEEMLPVALTEKPVCTGVKINDEPLGHAIQLTCTLDEKAPPLQALTTEEAISPSPILYLMLNDRDAYETLCQLRLVEVDVFVQVKGLQNLFLENADGLPNASKPFAPFGDAPEAGSRLYIAHPELAVPGLGSVNFDLNWKNLPPGGLGDYYDAYRSIAGEAFPIRDNASFKTGLYLKNGRQTQLLATAEPLFSEAENLQAKVDLATKDAFTSTPMTDDSASNWERHLWLELEEPGFQAVNYPLLVHHLAQTLSFGTVREEETSLGPGTAGEEKDILLRNSPPPGLVIDFDSDPIGEIQITGYNPIDRTIKVKYLKDKTGEFNVNIIYRQIPVGWLDLIVQPPFTPILNGLRVGYTARARGSAGGGTGVQIYYLRPFNGYERITEMPIGGIRFLPEYENEGELFLGISGLRPPQTLSLLLQMAAGSANPEREPPPVSWEYLRGNHWQAMDKGQILSDTTQGLLASGIIRFAIPADATQEEQTILPRGLHWLRARVNRFADGLSNTIAILPQAVRATMAKTGNGPDYLIQPLPPQTIAEPLVPISGLAALYQPFSSFGGRTAEAPAHFRGRVSERLRHKQRAISAWDYEHLVLEAFPDVYRVKCLSADLLPHPDDLGTVELVLIPDIRDQRPFNPFEPKLPTERLREVQAFLEQIAPPSARIRVRNPVYVQVQVQVGVRFRDRNNPGYYTQRLNRELQEFLAPWAFDHGAEISFAGEVYPSVVVNFLEKRPYIDYVFAPKLILLTKEANGNLKLLTTSEKLAGADPLHSQQGRLLLNMPAAILVSATEHRIEVINDRDLQSGNRFAGIGYQYVDIDFKIQRLATDVPF